MATHMGDERAWKNRVGIYLAAGASAELIADVFLCPLEVSGRLVLIEDR
jgi:hypothetical protein